MKLQNFIALAAAGAVALGMTACSSGSGYDFTPTAQDKKVVMTVGGEDVEYQEFRYFFLNNKRDNYGEDAALTSEQVEELRALTEDNARNRHALTIMAEQYGAKLSDEAIASVDASVDEYREVYCGGDDATYLLALEEQYMTDYLFRQLSRESSLAYAVLEKMIEKGEISVDDAAMNAALASDDVICIKEIYVTYNTTDTKEIARDRAEEALNKLTDGASFEDMMREYSDYNEADLPPEHGYYTMKYDALDEVWDTAITLAEGEYSRVVESPYGFHIIMRCKKDAAYMEENKDEIFENYTYSKFYEKFYPLMESLEITYTDYGKTLDLANLT